MVLFKHDIKIGKLWTDNDDKKLIKLYNEDLLDVIQLAIKFMRTPGGIAARLKKLNIIEERFFARGYMKWKKEIRETRKIRKTKYEKLKEIVKYFEKKINSNDINTMKNNIIQNVINFDDDTPNIELKDIFKKNKKVNKSFEPDYYVYTDGACTNNGKDNALAGIGIYFGKNDDRNVSKTIEGKQSNNTAELSAIIETYYIIENDILSGKKINTIDLRNYKRVSI